MSLKLEVGKRYRNRNGKIVKIIEYDDTMLIYAYTDEDTNTYQRNGIFQVLTNGRSKKDLIEEAGTDKEDHSKFGYEEKDLEIFNHREASTSMNNFFTSTNPKDLEGNKKPRISLVPPSAIIHLASAFKEGEEKYGAYNWRTNKVQAMIYLDAILRHVLAIVDGEDIDPESTTGKHHIDGVIASAAVYIDAMDGGNLIDNRPPKGTAGALIRKLGGK